MLREPDPVKGNLARLFHRSPIRENDRLNRWSLKGVKPTAPLSEIRARFDNVVRANVVFFSACAVVAVLDQLFVRSQVFLFALLPLLVQYLWCCSALGRLATCFGHTAWTATTSAFFFYPHEILLAYFAYGDGVRAALKQGRKSGS